MRSLWAEQFGALPRFHARRDFLVRCLAYRLQEQAFGALATATRKRLRKLAIELPTTPAAVLTDAPLAKPGTRLIRQWGGEAHTVTLADKGYIYRGQRYQSLSVIARLITGTRWSGPAFFGLKASKPGASKQRASGSQRPEQNHAR